MPFHVKDPETDRAVRRLAKLKGQSLTATIRESVEKEYARIKGRTPLTERLKPLQERFAAMSRRGGRPADEAFFDDLSGDA